MLYEGNEGCSFEEISAFRHECFDPNQFQYLYSDRGSYCFHWLPLGFTFPDRFVVIEGDPVPCDTQEEFHSFLRELRISHDIVSGGRVMIENGSLFIRDGHEFEIYENWKYRTNRATE